MRCHWDGQGEGHSKPAANPGVLSPTIASRAGAHPHVGIDRHPHPSGFSGTGSTGGRTGLADGTIAGLGSVGLAERLWEHRDCCVVFQEGSN